MNRSLTPFVSWSAGEVLVLASASPRRAELLQVAGIPFEVRPAPAAAETNEAASLVFDPAVPWDYPQRLAEAKAEAVAAVYGDRLVLGADTIVILDDDMLEKPVDAADAVSILGRLQGRCHTVISAIALVDGARRRQWSGWAETEVEFRRLGEGEIRDYVATGEPMDKAGAYGIQGYGAMMVCRVEGCYFNVMGLPLALLAEALRELLSAPSERR